MKTLLVLGAGSAIVFETLKNFANDKCNFILVGRNQADLEKIRNDLLVRGADQIGLVICELGELDSAKKVFDKISDQQKLQIDLVYIGYGLLLDNQIAISDSQSRSKLITTNFNSVVEHTQIWFNYFCDHKKQATIVVISSVAGLRGRKSNFVYGSAKAGLNAYLSGLRNLGASLGIHVLTIMPGFVDTPMTANLNKGPLFVEASYVGEKIYHAIKNKKDIFYVPWWWQVIMAIICAIPERIFKRLSI